MVTGISDQLVLRVYPHFTPWVPASQERIGPVASATSRAPVFSHSSSATSTRPHFSPNDVNRRHHHHPFSIMRVGGPWCLFPTRPTCICSHADILSAASRSPPGKPILLPFDCGVMSTMRINRLCALSDGTTVLTRMKVVTLLRPRGNTRQY